MRHGWIALLLILIACSGPPAEVSSSDSPRMTVDLVKVVDGDTIKVRVDGKEETVRFLLVDTPETRHPDKPVQPFGPEAKAFVEEVLSDGRVDLELDVGERDKYRRLLAYVYPVGDDRSVQEMLLSRGLARVAYVYPPNVKYVEEFRAAQREAQRKGIGIWSLENYVREDGFNGKGFVSKTSETKPGAYVASKHGEVYYPVDCPGARRIKPENLIHFDTEEEAKDRGLRRSQSQGCWEERRP